MSVKTEEIRSFWLYCRKTLSLTEQNFYFVQLINLSFRGQITDRFGLLRWIYDVLHYCAVFCSESIGMYRLLHVSLASRISYRLISTIYDSRTAGYTAVNLTHSTTALYDFCHTTGCCPKIYIKMFQLCTAP